jgi:hypothetical protein
MPWAGSRNGRSPRGRADRSRWFVCRRHGGRARRHASRHRRGAGGPGPDRAAVACRRGPGSGGGPGEGGGSWGSADPLRYPQVCGAVRQERREAASSCAAQLGVCDINGTLVVWSYPDKTALMNKSLRCADPRPFGRQYLHRGHGWHAVRRWLGTIAQGRRASPRQAEADPEGNRPRAGGGRRGQAGVRPNQEALAGARLAAARECDRLRSRAWHGPCRLRRYCAARRRCRAPAARPPGPARAGRPPGRSRRGG